MNSRNMKKSLQSLVLLVSAMMCALGTSAAEAYACYTSSNTTLTFYCDNERASRTGTTYNLNTGDNRPGWVDDGTNSSVTRVVFNFLFAAARPTSTHSWFENMENLTSIVGMKYLNTEKVTNMSLMFYWCNALTSLDLSSFNTSQVTDMNSMFYHCYSLNSLNVSSFNTANVINMSNMFGGCIALTNIDVSNFNTENVHYMAVMFQDCRAMTSIDVSSFNTQKVEYMTGMFSGCTGLTTLDLSRFNTRSAISLEGMFSGCTGLTSLDLSSFSTTNVNNTYAMFYNCTGLTTIYVSSGWSSAGITQSSYMFNDCTSLVGGQGTTFDANHIDAEYARIDGGASNPGYFTAKSQRGDVNDDGVVNIADVTSLIDYLLSGNTTGVNIDAADCNIDDNVNIADVTALIDYLLSGTWN